MKIDKKAKNHEEKRLHRMILKISRGRKKKPDYEEKSEIETALRHYHGGNNNEEPARVNEKHKALQYEEKANDIALT